MFELSGKYNTCKIFTDNCDNETISQLTDLLNQESVKGSKIRIMPDTHAGKGCVIGTTMTLQDKVIPNLVGVDIGCGMLAIKLKEKEIDLKLLDEVINEYIPAGPEIHENPVSRSSADKIIAPVDVDKAFKSLSSLGGGNHFIEIDRGSHGNLWLVVHTGSRHLGLEVCEYYQNRAYERLQESAKGGSLKQLINSTISELKTAHREKEISKQIEKIKADYERENNTKVPRELAYLTGQDFDDYIHDMQLTQQHAAINRKCIADTIITKMDLHPVSKDCCYDEDYFDTIHNYIDCDNMILRKGSVSAELGEWLIIPMNMRDGSLICIGKGNPDWNYSAPHGAGRIMSRSQAKDRVNLDDFEESMKGIYSTSVCESTIDESPFVYKPMQEIIDNIKDTVEIVDIIKPIYNFKAH